MSLVWVAPRSQHIQAASDWKPAGGLPDSPIGGRDTAESRIPGQALEPLWGRAHRAGAGAGGTVQVTVSETANQ